jgi:mannose-6-phosphate isomerase class I
MSSPAKAAKEVKVLAVIKLANEEMSISAACKKIGIARSSFYDYCQREPEAIEMFQDMITQSSRIALIEVLITRAKLTHKLIEVALSGSTKPMELLEIFKVTDKYLDKLLRYMRIDGGDDPEAAAEALAGPILTPGVSRFTPEYPSREEKTGV